MAYILEQHTPWGTVHWPITDAEIARWSGQPYSRHARRKYWLSVRNDQRRPPPGYARHMRPQRRLRLGGTKHIGPTMLMHSYTPVTDKPYLYFAPVFRDFKKSDLQFLKPHMKESHYR